MQILVDTLILTLVAIESFLIGLCLAAWYRAHGRLHYSPKWTELDGLSEEQIEELKKFLRKLRSDSDADTNEP